MLVVAGARNSPLSVAQFYEIERELSRHHPHVSLRPHFIETTGDVDKKTSLRGLEKSNFFTKEIDEMLIAGKCRIAIHSAKDLPDPFPKGLAVVAFTRGVDPSDVLVLRPEQSLDSLPAGARIATSSARREASVSVLRKDLAFVDIRGTIGERIAALENGKADGVVIAEAALIRLGLTHLNRVPIPGETAPFQGRLAVMAREGDEEMREVFRCLNSP